MMYNLKYYFLTLLNSSKGRGLHCDVLAVWDAWEPISEIKRIFCGEKPRKTVWEMACQKARLWVCVGVCVWGAGAAFFNKRIFTDANFVLLGLEIA